MTDTTFTTRSTSADQILDHFGPDALTKLNTYACSLEDMLIEALEKQKALEQELATCHEYINKVQLVLQAAADEREARL